MITQKLVILSLVMGLGYAAAQDNKPDDSEAGRTPPMSIAEILRQMPDQKMVEASREKVANDPFYQNLIRMIKRTASVAKKLKTDPLEAVTAQITGINAEVDRQIGEKILTDQRSKTACINALVKAEASATTPKSKGD